MAFLNPFLQSREQISNLPSSQENVETLSNIGEESENETASIANSSSAAESASLPSRSETPHQISGDGKPPTRKRKCKRNIQGPASAVASVLEKFLDSTKPQEPKPDPIHHLTFKTFPPDIQ
jgi:hypothetical protein